VALGRAIIRRPKAFLMDEPLGTLDAEFRTLMCAELRALHNRIGATTVYVTHDQLEAMSMADTIAIMNRGVVEQLGPPQQVYDRPASLFVADFVGSPAMNLLSFKGSLDQGADKLALDGTEIVIPPLQEPAAGPELVLGVRPEHVRFTSEGGLRGQVFGAEYLGSTQVVTVDTAVGQVKARLPADRQLKLGEPIGLTFRPERLSLFDKASGRAVRSALHEGVPRG